MTTAAKETTGLVNVKALDFSLVEKFKTQAQVKESSLKSYLKGIKRFMEFCVVNNIAAPTVEVMFTYRQHLEATYTSPATRNLYISGLKKFMAFLQNEGYIATNPVSHIKGFNVSELHSKSALTASDVRKVFGTINTSTLKGKRDAALYALLVTCGLRCIEAVRANVDDFELSGNGVVRLHVQGKGRDDKKEAVNVPAGVYQLIQTWLDARGEVPADDKGTPLFCSLSRNGSFGGRITTTSISRTIKAILKSAGYDDKRLTTHSLRHTAATTALKSGATLREVQQMCRHKNVAVTQIYLHELEELENSATRKAAAAFGF